MTFDDTQGERRLLLGDSADVGILLDARSDILRVLTAALMQGAGVRCRKLTERTVPSR